MRIVDRVTCYALEEELDIYAVEVRTEVQTEAYFRERITDDHLVILIQFAVAVHIFVPSVTGVYADLLFGIGAQLRQSLFIALIDSFVLVSPEGVQRQSFISLGAVAPQR